MGKALDGVAELLAREEIRDVLALLARATDRRDVEAIRSCYHPGATDDHGGYQGDAAGFAEWVPQVLALFETTMHVLGNVHFDVKTRPEAEATHERAHTETYCTAHHIFPASDPGGARDSIMGLRYLDHFERREGVWKIAARVCAYDYSYVVPIAEAWPLDPPYVRGVPGPSDPSYRR